MSFEFKRTETVITIKKLINLKGRRALITGAVGGLGKVMADTLAELGADLVLVDRLGSDFESLAETLTQRWGVKVEYRYCDLEQQNQRSELIEWLKNSGESLNILINNAAFVGSSELQGWAVPFEEQTTSDNEQILKAFTARLPRGKQLPCTLYVNASNNEASATQYAQTLATHIRANGLQARIVRRAQSFNAAATIELIVAVEEK